MTKPFGAHSTTDEVLAGVDLAGKRMLVTGVSAGIGVETARALAAHGACVIGTVRDLTKGRRATAGVPGIELIELDLASLKSVRAAADQLNAKGAPFDLVIANAGVMAIPTKTFAVDGFETQFGTNHLGHFVLVNRIASLFNSGARLVNLSSVGHRYSDVNLEDPNFERTEYTDFGAYGRSKTANILFAVEFDRRHQARRVRATAVHPGGIQTELSRHMRPTRSAKWLHASTKTTRRMASPRSHTRPSRKAPRPAFGLALSRVPWTWAAAIAKIAMSPRSSTAAPICAAVCAATRSTANVQRRCGPRASKWWTSTSDLARAGRANASSLRSHLERLPPAPQVGSPIRATPIRPRSKRPACSASYAGRRARSLAAPCVERRVTVGVLASLRDAARLFGADVPHPSTPTARACCRFESCREAHAPRQPCRGRRNESGAVTSPAPWVGMTRTDNKPLFRNRSAARSAFLDERARGMRASLTPSEALLWARIRGRRLGPVFRRQVPLLGRFIADFLAPAERLVIEVDGGHHAEQARADAYRDAVLARAGHRVLRLVAALVVRDIEAAVSRVRAAFKP
jgi:NAD(P)-dependent dehydrogenase (short-subunit alcohol dehydrogenase family)/very-short-patch-repair endonuclease